MATTLPSGPRGRVLALGLTLLAALALWLGLVSPLLGWYGERAEELDGRRVLAEHLEGVARTLPGLERRLAAGAKGEPGNALLAGATDVLAGATLQQRVVDIAMSAGAGLSSVEVLAAEPAEGARRIRLRVAVAGSWPVLVKLLEALDTASPQMVVTELHLRAVEQREPRALNGSFVVAAFRAAPSDPAAASPARVESQP